MMELTNEQGSEGRKPSWGVKKMLPMHICLEYEADAGECNERHC